MPKRPPQAPTASDLTGRERAAVLRRQRHRLAVPCAMSPRPVAPSSELAYIEDIIGNGERASVAERCERSRLKRKGNSYADAIIH
jgi:hypothetical protein